MAMLAHIYNVYNDRFLNKSIMLVLYFYVCRCVGPWSFVCVWCLTQEHIKEPFCLRDISFLHVVVQTMSLLFGDNASNGVKHGLMTSLKNKTNLGGYSETVQRTL